MQVLYDDSTHTYTCRGRRYISATQIIDFFKEKFDTKAEAAKYADRHGGTAAYWTAKWEEIKGTSLVRGNGIHELREELTLNRGMDVFMGKAYRVQNPDLVLPEVPYALWPDGIFTERLLWHHGYGIAGRCDKVIFESISEGNAQEWFTQPGRYAHLEDYKSNRRIRIRGFQYKDGTHARMLAPISHLEDCEFVHYTLQLSLYQLMLEYLGFKPGQRIITHFPHVPDMAPFEAKAPPPVYYPVPYLKKEVLSMLNYLKTRRIL